jgi:hypothetical protein
MAPHPPLHLVLYLSSSNLMLQLSHATTPDPVQEQGSRFWFMPGNYALMADEDGTTGSISADGAHSN